MSIEEITIAELVQRFEDGSPVVLDVRELDEYVAGHVPGAHLIPLSELPERIADVPTASPLLVICRSGARSLKACEMLAAAGIAGVNVAGGTLAWIDGGHPVTAGADRG